MEWISKIDFYRRIFLSWNHSSYIHCRSFLLNQEIYSLKLLYPFHFIICISLWSKACSANLFSLASESVYPTVKDEIPFTHFLFWVILPFTFKNAISGQKNVNGIYSFIFYHEINSREEQKPLLDNNISTYLLLEIHHSYTGSWWMVVTYFHFRKCWVTTT